MNGFELLAKLHALSYEELCLQVFAEGCDCVGPAVSIRVSKEFDENGGEPVPVILVGRGDE
jgi:hypothetical protein